MTRGVTRPCYNDSAGLSVNVWLYEGLITLSIVKNKIGEDHVANNI